MKIKTFSHLPVPFDEEFKQIYYKFYNLEINLVNSKNFLSSLSKISSDENWITLSIIKYVMGETEFQPEYKGRGVWSFWMGETINGTPCIQIIPLKNMLDQLYFDSKCDRRINNII